MTIIKRPLNPRRLRSALPRGFGWIDHRFLTEGYLARLSPSARGLYCLLICAADSQGLSYYSEGRQRELLGIDPATLLGARRELLAAGLIAYQKPLCQVLTLEEQRFATETAPQQPAKQPAPKTSSRPVQPEEKRALPAGLSLVAMVEASLRQGGIV